jgi:hypothetical protein
MSKEANIVHKKVGEIFGRAIPANSDLTLLRDAACGGEQHIPLFREPHKSRINEYCNVGLLILKHNKIKAIVEIERALRRDDIENP